VFGIKPAVCARIYASGYLLWDSKKKKKKNVYKHAVFGVKPVAVCCTDWAVKYFSKSDLRTMN
jgi:hypothetical protein